MPVHPQAQALIDQFAAFGLENLSDLDHVQLRAVTDELARQRPREDVSEARDVRFAGPGGELWARLYRPSGAAAEERLPLLVWFHGGGWVIGSVEGSDGTCRAMANRSGAAVLSVEYRLAPEHVYPAAVDDCWAATRWAAEQSALLGIDPTRLAVGGDSAGGNLAAVVALLARDEGRPELALQVLVYPAVDASMASRSIEENGKGLLLTKQDMDWFYGHYGRGAAGTDWRMSPALAPTLEGVAPACVLTAEYDPLRDEGEAYADELRAAGVPVDHRRYDGMIHGFFGMLGDVDDAQVAHEHVAAALRRAFRRASASSSG